MTRRRDRTARPIPSTSPTLAGATTELCDALARVHAEDRFGDLALCDALEGLALALWAEVLEQVGLPPWSAMPAPRHRWVVLERAAWRLARRIDDAGLGSRPITSGARAHLERVRRCLASDRPERPTGSRSLPADAGDGAPRPPRPHRGEPGGTRDGLVRRADRGGPARRRGAGRAAARR